MTVDEALALAAKKDWGGMPQQMADKAMSALRVLAAEIRRKDAAIDDLQIQEKKP